MVNSFNARKHQRITPTGEPASPRVGVDGRDDVDRASFDSFPASDPPSWNGVRLGSPSDALDTENGDRLARALRTAAADDVRRGNGE